MSYYEIDHPKMERLTDEDWEAKLQAGDIPDRPAFTKSYLAPALP